MRQTEQHQNRECLVPDMPRTFHLPSKDKALPARYQDQYFDRKNTFEEMQHPVKLSNLTFLTAHDYEDVMHKMVSNAMLVDHKKNPCSDDFMKNASVDQTYVLYFSMMYEGAPEVFLNIAKCLKVWDVDARGFHKGAVRLFYNKAHLVLVGYPNSPYSIYKPNNIAAIYF